MIDVNNCQSFFQLEVPNLNKRRFNFSCLFWILVSNFGIELRKHGCSGITCPDGPLVRRVSKSFSKVIAQPLSLSMVNTKPNLSESLAQLASPKSNSHLQVLWKTSLKNLRWYFWVLDRKGDLLDFVSWPLSKKKLIILLKNPLFLNFKIWKKFPSLRPQPFQYVGTRWSKVSRFRKVFGEERAFLNFPVFWSALLSPDLILHAPLTMQSLMLLLSFVRLNFLSEIFSQFLHTINWHSDFEAGQSLAGD